MPGLRQLFLQHIAQTSDIPLMLEIEKAEGSYLYDKNGKAYLDLIGGISVSAIGHRHPKVLQAISRQLDKYLHTLVYGEFVLSPQVKLAELLTQQMETQNIPLAHKNPYGKLDSVYFVNSGSEATEGAMKLAKRYTGRREIMAFRNAYHGSTQGAASLMSPTIFTQAYYPLLPGIKHLDYNNFESLSSISKATAAVIIEPVQAESGVIIPEYNFLQNLRRQCTETGALLIFDEAQTGFGRTGSLFAFQKYGVEPDILLLAKAMGGGMPLGAFISTKAITACLSYDPPLGHITTFGGHPVSCASGHATLQILIENDILSLVGLKENFLLQSLAHPAIMEIRSSGLLMALELEDSPTVRRVMHECLENGVITDWFLFNDRCLRIAPPLTISLEELEMACSVILKALDKVQM